MALATRFEGAQGRLAGVREEVTELARDAGSIGADLKEIARAEVRLAAAETKEQAGIAVRISAAGVVALIMANIALLFTFVTIMFALDEALPLWAAALITTAIAALLAGIAALMARSFARKFSPAPRRTIDSIREDIRWAKSQLTSSER
jgi:uncharacterized membrane protein YqjE